jgi:aerobic carbon-monoxide dehydrogenase small subunit
MESLELNVNGQTESLRVDSNRLLVEVLRVDLGLTGTHVGCDTAQCGACTVLVDGHAVKSCNVLALQVAGCEITTIEGLSPPDGSMHVMQQAFKECHGLQCGFCTPGMVLSSIDLVQNHPCESEVDVRNGLDGHFCRCTGYQNIVRAVLQAAPLMKR